MGFGQGMPRKTKKGRKMKDILNFISEVKDLGERLEALGASNEDGELLIYFPQEEYETVEIEGVSDLYLKAKITDTEKRISLVHQGSGADAEEEIVKVGEEWLRSAAKKIKEEL